MKKTNTLRADPLVCFGFLALSNAILAYSSLSYSIKGWIFAIGILTPFAALLMEKTKDKNHSLFSQRLSIAPGSWVWITLALFAAWLRFYKLTSFHLWPTGDEALHGFLAIPLTQNWSWQFFYTVGEHPPLLIWCLSFFFKFFDSPFFDLWFLPAIISAAMVPVGYWAIRQYFSKTTALLFVLLLAVSYWPLYFGRFCHQGIFVPLFEIFSFGLLGHYLNSKGERRRSWLIFALGLWVGLGSFTFTSWAVVILLITITVAGICLKKKSPQIKPFLFYSLGLFIALLPFFLAAYNQGYGHHLIDSSAASSWFSRPHQILTYVSYLTCFFWGNLQPGASYAPTWGGILNPLLGACFFLGLAELFQRRKAGLAQWILLAFMICLLPGFLSADYVEFNRVIQTMPLLLLIVVVGLQKLLAGTQKKHRLFWLLLALVSVGLDLFHLNKPALEEPVFKMKFKSDLPDESFQAYKLLEENFKRMGPGVLFTDFLLLSHAHMLSVTAYHFNTALNPALADAKPQWAGIVANRHYQFFLSKRFQNSKWYPINAGSMEDGGLVVGIIPLADWDEESLRQWLGAHRYFHALSLQAENILNNKEVYQSALDHLPEGLGLMKGDPFLESVYAEWMAQYHFDSTCEKNILIIQRGLLKGYPSAHLKYKLGGLYVASRQWGAAREAYGAALRTSPNYTNAGDVLKWLENAGH